MKTLTAATRAGKLAARQTEIVTSRLKANFPDIHFEIKKITTKGDTDRKTALWNVEGTGFFTSRLEQALLDNQADFAVHSYKDLPTESPQELAISAVCERDFPQDCIVAGGNIKSVEQLNKKPVIGTSSLRRNVQMKKLCPDCIIKPIRGNVPRRIELAEEGELDGVILAYAGLKRLGMQKKASVVFRKEQMLCAPAQGALAVQTRKGDKDTVKIVSSINEEETNLCTAAERQILVSTGCGCHAPVGAFAQISGNDIAISAFISDLDVENFIRYTLTGKKDNAVDIAKHLAGKLLDNGGSEILENLENNNHSPLF